MISGSDRGCPIEAEMLWEQKQAGDIKAFCLSFSVSRIRHRSRAMN
jgi:hypothetical protein